MKRHREKMAIDKPRREAWKRFFLTVLRRNQPCQHLDFRLLASRTVRQYISVVEASQLVVFCHGSTSKMIQSVTLIVKQRHSKIHLAKTLSLSM